MIDTRRLHLLFAEQVIMFKACHHLSELLAVENMQILHAHKANVVSLMIDNRQLLWRHPRAQMAVMSSGCFCSLSSART